MDKDTFLSHELNGFNNRRLWLRQLYCDGLVDEATFVIGTLLIDLKTKGDE